MKRLVVFAFALISIASFAGTTPPVLLKSIVLHANLMPPVISDLGQTHLEVEVLSCKKVHPKDWQVVVTERGVNDVLLSIVNNHPVDCEGFPSRQRLLLKSSDIPARAQVTLENPVLIDRKIVY